MLYCFVINVFSKRASVAEHDGVDGGDVAAGYVSVAINVAIDEVASVVVEQAVIERGDVATVDVPVAVHVAKQAADSGLSRHIAVGIIQDSTRKIPSSGFGDSQPVLQNQLIHVAYRTRTASCNNISSATFNHKSSVGRVRCINAVGASGYQAV